MTMNHKNNINFVIRFLELFTYAIFEYLNILQCLYEFYSKRIHNN